MPKAQPTYERGPNHDMTQAYAVPPRWTGLACADNDLARRCLRSCWRDGFSAGLPNPAVTHVVATYSDPLVHAPLRAQRARNGARAWVPGTLGRGTSQSVSDHGRHSADVSTVNPRTVYGPKRADRRPNPPLTAGWLHERVGTQLRAKRGARAVLNSVIAELNNDVRDGVGGPVVGVRLTLSGRLGKQKKGMAQTISRSIGRVPLSSLRSKVELSQGFVITPLGCVGLKVWVCYA